MSTEDATVLAADRVPWVRPGGQAYVIDVDPKKPRAYPVTMLNVNPRRIVTRGARRYLQARMTEIPVGSGHYGYRSMTDSTLLVGPDNPHVALIADHLKRTGELNALRDAWNALWLSRNDPAELRTAAKGLRTAVDTYLKGLDA